MRVLARTLLLLTAMTVVTRLVAMVVSKRCEEGTEVSDEFRRLAVLGGLEFTSRAGGLRRADIRVVLAGAKVDLRHASLDPAGARILVDNTLGGLILLVRDDWAVSVDDTLIGGGETQVAVTPPTEVPADAPRLEVQVLTRLGGTVITTDASSYTRA